MFGLGLAFSLMTLMTSTVIAQPLPEPIQALQDRGATIGESFEAPGGLTGYTVSFQGQTLAAYLTAGESHVLVGTLLDSDGTNLSQPIIDAAASASRPEEEWSALAAADWIADGASDAPRVVYAITDPNCPFCHQFYVQARDWVDAGAVQIRHVMVGVLREDSLAKSATLLAADNPREALAAHEAKFDEGGVTPLDSLPPSATQAVRDNNQLMSDLGIRGTPSVFYRTDEGDIALVRGLPRGPQVQAVLGSRPE